MENKLDTKKPFTPALLMLVSYASVSAVLVGPAIPQMRVYFGVSNFLIQLTVVVFLLFYAIGQLLYGPLANRLGRKKTIYAGMLAGVLGSIFCALSGNINSFVLLLVGRVITAFGSGVGLVLTFTIINDYYYEKQAVKTTAWVAIAFAISPGISSTIGGQLAVYFGWESCFWFLAIYGSFIVLSCITLPETYKRVDYKALTWSKIYNSYVIIFSNTKLLCFSTILGLTTSVIYIFATVGPIIVVTALKVQPDIYGMLNLVLTSGLILGNIIVLKTFRDVSSLTLLKNGITVFSLGIILFAAFFLSGAVGVYAMFFPGFILFLGIALLYSSDATIAISKEENKADASAVMNFINMGIACLGTVIMSFSSFFNPVDSMPIILLLIMAIIIILYFIGKNSIHDSCSRSEISAQSNA